MANKWPCFQPPTGPKPVGAWGRSALPGDHSSENFVLLSELFDLNDWFWRILRRNNA